MRKSAELRKAEIVAAVQKATGRSVRVDGPLRLHILPSPRLVASGVSIGGLGAAPEPLLVAEKIETGVDLIPLFSKKLSINFVQVKQPVVTLIA